MSNDDQINKFMQRIEKNEFYKEQVFDQDLLNESIEAVSVERDEIAYLRKKVRDWILKYLMLK